MLSDITRLIKEVKELCNANRVRIEEQSDLLIDYCMRIANLGKLREEQLNENASLHERLRNENELYALKGQITQHDTLTREEVMANHNQNRERYGNKDRFRNRIFTFTVQEVDDIRYFSNSSIDSRSSNCNNSK